MERSAYCKQGGGGGGVGDEEGGECVTVCVCHQTEVERVTVRPPPFFTQRVGNFTDCKAAVIHKSPCKSVCLWCFGDYTASGSSCDTEPA